MVYNLKSSFPTININPDNIIYQYIKASAIELNILQSMTKIAADSLNPYTASDYYLPQMAIDYGLYKKPATYANGYVYCEHYPDNSSIPVDTIFQTANGKEYISTEEVTFSTAVKMLRGSGTDDGLPDPYTGLAGISAIYTDSALSNSVTGWTYATDVITWSGTISQGSYYYIIPSGTVYLQTPIEASTVGHSGNASEHTITSLKVALSNVDSVDNWYGLYNGYDIETPGALRTRLIGATRKSFNFADIQSIVTQIDGVKYSKVYQSLSPDKSIIDDWNNIVDCTGNQIALTGGSWGFSFYPSQHISSLGGIYVHAYMTGNSPPYIAYLRSHTSGLEETDPDTYLAKIEITKENFERDNVEAWQDVLIPLQYNGMDYTRTYRVYIEASGSADATNCIYVAATGVADLTYRNDHFTGSTTLVDTGLVYKTMYNMPGYNVKVIPRYGYVFATDIKPEIEAALDYVDGGGFSPVGIQRVIEEANRVYLGISLRLYIENNYTFSSVVDDAENAIVAYLDSLGPGDDIVFSKVEKAILNTNGVRKIINMKLGIDNAAWVTRAEDIDIAISSDEYPVLDLDGIYKGVAFEEG